MSKSKLIPELRFPEFVSAESWITKQFGELELDVSDGNYSSKYPSQSDFLKSGVPFLRANNLKFGTVSDAEMRFISKKQHSEITKGHLKKGDILLTTRGELGIVSLVPDEHIGSNINAQLVRINTCDKIVNTFLFQLLGYLITNGIFDSLSTGTALKQLPIGKLNQLELFLPKSITEQQKIASCLSSLDEVIAAHSQKLATLKDHKKGLMQILFPQLSELGLDRLKDDKIKGKEILKSQNPKNHNSDNVPKYRFPEFLEDGDWVEKKLGEGATFLKGKGISKADIVENGNLACIRYGELYTHYQETISEIKSYTNLNATDLVLSKANDVIIPASGENPN